MKYIKSFSLSFILLAIINSLLLIHAYPIALLLLINLIACLWFFVVSYRMTINQRHTINLIDTLLISLKQGDYAIRATDIKEPSLSSTVLHLNTLAKTMQDNQLQLASQKNLLEQIIATLDFALLVFDEDNIAFANDYATKNLGMSEQTNVSTWFKKLRQEAHQGKVSITINDIKHPFLIEYSECYVNAKSHTLLVLKQLDNILYQQEKDALQKFVRILSHEINNTLAPIGTVARSLKKRLGDDIDTARFNTGLDLINERAQYLKSFMDNYVALAKLPTANRQVVDCDALLAELSIAYPSLIVKAPQDLKGFFDISQIKQVLSHLINNSLESASPSPEVTLLISHNDEQLTFCVQDKGPGFSNIDEASAAFYTTKTNGNGIGLMLSRIIIDNHQSQLALKNSSPNGAEVSFNLEKVKISDD